MKRIKLWLWWQFCLLLFKLQIIYCEIHCEPPPPVAHGIVTGIKSGNYYLPYDEVEIQCEPGYTYNREAEFVMCEEDGNWDEDFGECVEILCDPPEQPANGMIPELQNSYLMLFPYNFEITYKCTQGYRLLGGDSWRFCGKRGWSGKAPNCKEIRCPDPGVPEYGSREGDNFQIGFKVRFKCFTGYNLLGSFERFCMPNGQWTGELTRCDHPNNYCPNPGIPINGFKIGAVYDIGDKVSFRCQPGYMLLGSDVRECLQNRTWSGKEVKCKAPFDFDNYGQMSEMLKLKVTEKFGEENKQKKQLETETSSVTHPWHFLKNKLSIDTMSDRSLTAPTFHSYDMLPVAAEDRSTFHHPTTNVSHKRRLILHFAFDVSGSIGPHYLQKSIEFAKAVVKKVGISRDGSRASAVVFSSKAQTKFYSMQIETEDEVLRHLDNISFTGGGTSATSALTLIKENIDLEIESNYYDRHIREDVVFIITDGKINMGGSPEREAKLLKERHIEIYCIGITGDPRIETLYKIASSSNYGDEERKNVFILQNYETLSHLIQEITNGSLDFSECGLGLENIAAKNEDTDEKDEKGNEPWPWMAGLYFLVPGRSRTYQIQCGGTIIKENFILTAAHCMYFKDKNQKILKLRRKEDILVKIGLFNLKDETKVQEFEVKRIFIHENYQPGNYSEQLYDYDIALLELAGSIEYGRRIRPICLPSKDMLGNTSLYSSKEFGWTGGWGHSGILNPYNAFSRNMQLINTPKLKQLRLPIQSNERCIKSLEEKSNTKYFTDRMFCAGTGKNGYDTCLGDSGGPFMQPQMNSQGFLYWTQVGIISWGIGCGMEDTYGYYTHVQKFRSWIDEITDVKK